MRTAQWLTATAKRLGRRPALVVAGRAGSQATSVINVFAQAGVATAATGEQDPRTLSQLLSAADLGIAPHPWALIGKSGVATAMREHGLPVLVPRDEWFLPGSVVNTVPPDPLLMRLDELTDSGLVDYWLGQRRSATSSLPAITASFLEALSPEAVLLPLSSETASGVRGRRLAQS
jgi:hypothetical protein